MYDNLAHNSVGIITMATTTFTTRIDVGLKARLQQIAETDKRSASFIANQAIENFIEEREETRKLVELGLEMAKDGVSISENTVMNWMDAPEGTPSPAPDTFD